MRLWSFAFSASTLECAPESAEELISRFFQPLLGLPILYGQHRLRDFVRLCQQQGLQGTLLIQRRMLKGSGQTHGQLNFHWWLPVYGNTGL